MRLLLFITSWVIGQTAISQTVKIPDNVVTIDVATAVKAFIWWTTDNNGNMLVCPHIKMYKSSDESCKDNGINRWTKATEVVPPGKTYVGFRRLSNGALEIYWK